MKRLVAALWLAAAALAEDQRFAGLGDFRLTGGETIRGCRIGYRTFGKLDAAKSNVVVFPTWFSGKSADLERYHGAGLDKLVGSKYFVVAIDALGNGVSSSPSNGQKPFPRFGIRDMVNSQHLLLTRTLGISHVRAVIGISMGGMQTFEWMSAYPDFMDLAIPIIGSPKLATPDLLLWQAQLGILELAQKGGIDGREAMKTVLAVHQFALHTPEYRASQNPSAEWTKFRAAYEGAAATGMAPEDWASQLRAMLAHDSGTGAGVRAKTLVVAATQDHMVNAGPSIEFARRTGAALLTLDGNCGHMAISCEAGKVNAAVRRFLGD